MTALRLEEVSKFYGAVQAVKRFSLSCADGRMLALLGPSGCGKTSTLKMIAGIEEVSEGEIYFDDRPVSGLAPGERNIAMVFEDYALYPHLSVYENIAFPLRVRKLPGAAVRRRVEPTLELLGLADIRGANVKNLSGGAQQRVSIGRALVRDPELIVFDEPLSHLDGDQKVQLRSEIKRLQKTTGLTAILVTHDQTEATAMADEVAVMDQGELQQVGSPHELYNRPANLFVANFIGEPPMNLLPATTSANGSGPMLEGDGWRMTVGAEFAAVGGIHRDLVVGIRPEHVILRPGADDAQAIRGVVTWREHCGDSDVLTVDLAPGRTAGDGNDRRITVETHVSHGVAMGETVALRFPDERINLFDADTGANLIAGTAGSGRETP